MFNNSPIGAVGKIITNLMSFIGDLFKEREDRPAILLRYENLPLLKQWQEDLNTGTHRCIIIKKNALTTVFIICSSKVTLEIEANYDANSYCFLISGCKVLDSLQSTSIEFGRVSHIDQEFEFAIKTLDRKYKNFQSLETTSNLQEEIEVLANYDAVLEDLRRQEEIRKREEQENEDAKKQLEVWTNYVKKERELLDWADKPFVLGNSAPVIKKNMVDVEAISHFTSLADSSDLESISEDIDGAIVEGDKLVMTLDNFKKLQKWFVSNPDVKIKGQITLKMTVCCDGHRSAVSFMHENGYQKCYWKGLFSYGKYDEESESIELTFLSKRYDEVLEFYNRVNNSFKFKGNVPEAMVHVSFALSVTTVETDDERKKRIDILSGCDLFSMPDNDKDGIFLGKLSKNGSDKKHLRIFLPQDKEEKQKAIDFFKEREHSKIYPGLVMAKAILKREKDALDKLRSSQGLKNKGLKDFIFNSCRAQATEVFVGLDSDNIAETSQYQDCQQSQMLLLNASQQEAVVKGLYAKDLCLLQGPPGTGKTTVISELIWQHIRQNQQIRIMLTSQTNLAIDNALNRLFSNSAIIEGSPAWRNMMLIKPVRVADVDKIEEEGLPFSAKRIEDWVSGQDEDVTSNNIVHRWMQHISQRVDGDNEYAEVLSEWKSSLDNPSLSMRAIFANQYRKDSNVLCMTCGKVGSRDFNQYEAGKGFDVVIVDEASKATLPELVMPLCYADKSIIIGDHRQLPPVIFEDDFFQKVREADPELEEKLSRQFKHELVENSLFKRLITHPNLSPSIKATFNVQYRMHPDINAVISQFYASDSGGLQCGLDMAKVDVSDFAEKDSRYHGLSFDGFIQPNVHTIWVDVPDGMEQGGEGSSTFNEKEVEAVKLVLEALAKSDGFNRYMKYWTACKNVEERVTESKIGVISFYAAQVGKIRGAVQSFCDRNEIKIATKSVDKFQGQESGIVIVSTVRTKRLGFTRTPERLNVALSRARRLLIIVGNSTFYSSDNAKTEEGQYIYRNVIEQIKDDNNCDVFIDYRKLRTLLGY